MPKKNPQIACFVFFDIETTGLPREEKNLTKIIEYSFVAVLRKDLELTPYGEIPATVRKLTSLLNPDKKVCRVVTQMTGLSRKKLSKAPTFEQKFQSIKAFLEDLPPPVCLISHNGNTFDFKILLAESNDISASLPANLYSVDSLVGFRALLMCTGINYTSLYPRLATTPLVEQSVSSNDNAAHKVKHDKNEIDAGIAPKQNHVQVGNIVPKEHNYSMASEQSFVPTSSTDDNTALDDDFPNVILSTEDERIEEVVINGANTSISADSDVENQDQNIITQIYSDSKIIPMAIRNSDSTERECFKLTSMYKRLLNREQENAHRAEGDCLMLLYCVVAMKKDFLPWADKNCQLLSNITAIKRGQRYWRGNYYRRFR